MKIMQVTVQVGRGIHSDRCVVLTHCEGEALANRMRLPIGPSGVR